MSPVADGADLSTPAEAPAAEALLQDGEVILLMIRPSKWFVLLTAWPVLAAAAFVAIGGCIADVFFPAHVPKRMVVLVCLLIAAARVLAACFQWTSRLYVLTNRRALQFRGTIRPMVTELPLRSVLATHLSASRLERPLGVSTLAFEPKDGRAPLFTWLHISRGEEVRQIVDEALRRAR